MGDESGKYEVNSDEIRIKERRLGQNLASMGRVLVAFSGGVDSSFLLLKAIEACGPDRVLAVTAITPFSVPGETDAAAGQALELGVSHETVYLDLLLVGGLGQNPPARCYICKKQIFGRLLQVADERGCDCVIDGSNADDPSLYRPGIAALQELKICSPLLEAGLTKGEIRELARRAGLSSWNRPAGPCLASRFPYGEELTVAKLERVALAEAYLRQIGVTGDLRVRSHRDLARIELGAGFIEPVLDRRAEITAKLLDLGYSYVTLDLCGFRSGSMDWRRNYS